MIQRSSEDESRAGSGPAPRPALAKAVHRVVQVTGVLVVLVLLDVALGTVLTGTGWLPGERGDLARLESAAVRQSMASPVMASSPWAREYGEEFLALDLQGGRFTPYLVRSQAPFHGRYINTTDRERVSYRPALGPGDRPVRIAFLGGSTMFGVGQRDEHTIPSEVARLAEADGLPVEVHNFGFPAWVAWQEMLYLEQVLADGGEFDLIVVYDGSNDFDVQGMADVPGPYHAGALNVDELIDGYKAVHDSPPRYLGGADRLWAAYRRASGTTRLIDRLRGQTTAATRAMPQGLTGEQQVRATLAVHRRAMDLIGDLAERHGATTRFFWQPRAAGWDPALLAELPPDVTDVSGVFGDDGDEYYFDGVHTNEAGARVVARSLWEHLEADVAGLARDQRR